MAGSFILPVAPQEPSISDKVKTRMLDCWARLKGKLSWAANISSSVLSSYQLLDFFAGLRYSIIWSRLADKIAVGEGKEERMLKAVGLHK
jgi:hypothetical protein